MQETTFLKGASKYLKMAFFCVLVISDQLCNANGPPAQVQRVEVATRLSYGETVGFLQAVVFVLCETLVQLVEVEAVRK